MCVIKVIIYFFSYRFSKEELAKLLNGPFSPLTAFKFYRNFVSKKLKMKVLPFLKLMACAAVLFSSSCAKDKDASPEPSTPPSGPFVAKVDNQAFPTADLQFTKAKFVASTKMLQIVGQPKDRKETIILNLIAMNGKVIAAADWKPGDYDFDPAHVSRLEYQASAEYNKWNGNGYDQWFTVWEYVKTGKITIESNTGKHIKGTFSFDAVLSNGNGSYNTANIKKITSGSFDLDIVTQ
jgi:hypothetical protein